MRSIIRLSALLLSCFVLSILLAWYPSSKSVAQDTDADGTSMPAKGRGALTAWDNGKRVECPLKHTSVIADVTGYAAAVTVRQTFKNSCNHPLEAVYTFPLPENSAVYEMNFKSGSHEIKGVIKKREEARAIYETARANGQAASLLDQQRPNVFTQSVANLVPNRLVTVEIKYTTRLAYKDGCFNFVFPTVVGPRFSPGAAVHATNTTPDTTLVPDASKISPPIISSTDAGHDISIAVRLNSGVPYTKISSALHPIALTRIDPTHATITALEDRTLEDRDFVLRWQIATDKLRPGIITHRIPGAPGYFSLMMVPPAKVDYKTTVPKELIFIVDRSGSQEGFPLDKAKDTMRYMVTHMNPNDTFQIISFANTTESLFPKPESANAVNIARALAHIDGLHANGGTYMKEAIAQACAQPADNHRLRIVSIMTDGYIGNDEDILATVRQLRGTSRWFPFGTGSSVNRFLIEEIAKQGGGEPEYVLPGANTTDIARRFYEKVSGSVLSNVELAADGVTLTDVYPQKASDVWQQRPLFFTGRYNKPGKAVFHLRGYTAAGKYDQEMVVSLPATAASNELTASTWARDKVNSIMEQDWSGLQTGSFRQDLKQQVLDLGIRYHLLTPFTSFIAVDPTIVANPSTAKTVMVPTQLPRGVSLRMVGTMKNFGLVGAPVDPRFGQSNEVGQLGTINETYRGMHQWFNDDLVGNLFGQIGQLIGKWMSELIDGTIADTVQILGTLVGGLARQFTNAGVLFTVGTICLQWIVPPGLVVLLFTALHRRRHETEATGSRSEIVLPAFALLLSASMPITVAWLSGLLLNSAGLSVIDANMASMVRGSILAGIGGLASAFAPLIGAIGGGIGFVIGEILAFCGLIVCIALQSWLALQMMVLVCQLAGQLALVAAEVTVCPVALLMPRYRSKSERILRLCAETYLWIGMDLVLMSLATTVAAGSANPWAKMLTLLIIFQSMLAVPRLLAQHKISDIAKFTSRRITIKLPAISLPFGPGRRSPQAGGNVS